MNVVDTVRSKRTLTTPSPPPSLKRSKSEHHDAKLAYCSPPPLPLSAAQGVERIPLPISANVNCLSSQYLEQLVNERTNTLHGQGRRVVGLPVVLNDGIVLNWVRHGLIDVLKVDSPLVRQRLAWSAQRGSEKPRLSVVSIDSGSGTSAADAIIIDSDDDTSRASSLSRTHTPNELAINHDTSNPNVSSYSASDIELLSAAHSESKAEGHPETSPAPFSRELSPADVSDTMSSDSSPSRALTREEDTVAPCGLPSDGTDVTTSDSEIGEADKEVKGVKGIDGSRISARYTKSLSPPSLQPIRKLLAGRKGRGDSEGDILPEGTTVVPEVSQKQGRTEGLEEAPAITGDESDEESDCQASDPQLKRVPLPKTKHGRARRLLMPESGDLPLVAVTMRGDCHFIERRMKHRISGYSLPNPGVFRHVEDACMVGNTAILGCDKGKHQISFLTIGGKPQMIDVARSPHSSGPRYQDTHKRGVSRLAAIHAEGGHIKFLSGGYDGTIHEWTAGVDQLDEPRSRTLVSHGTCIMALAYRDRDRSVVVSAQRRLHITDLNRCTTMTHPFSNDIQQIHIHPQAAYVTLLEVRHLDSQIQLYDSRKGDFDGKPCMSFGHRNTHSKFSSQHTRGSVHLVHFAQANEDGVLLWDFRNSKRAVVERRFEQAEKVVNAIFTDRDVAAYGQGVVTFFEDYLT